MAIFRGVGGSGDSSDSSFLQAITEQAEAAEASRLASASAANLAVTFASTASTAATTATTQANSILNLTAATGDAGTNASYDASTGVLTIPRGADGSDATVNTSNVTAAGAAMLTGANFTGAVNVYGGALSVGSLGSNQNLNVVGNIIVSGTVDGRDVATDGTKLDGIEASADVTDTANVTAAGALMDSEVTNLAQVKAFNSSDYATAAQGSTADSAMQDLVDDTTPQLGGGLDASGNDIFNINNLTSGQLTIGQSGFSTISDINLNGNDITSGGDITGNSFQGRTTTGGVTTAMLDLEKNTTGTAAVGHFIKLKTKSHSTGSIISKGHIGLSHTGSTAFAVPYFSHSEGNCGFALNYSGSSSFNAIIPASTSGFSTSSDINLGHQYARFNGVYLKISPNVSSDREYKRDIEELSEAEKRVAVACKGLIRKYRMRDAYEEKGESARLHIGIIAQDLQDAFTAESLDAHRYGMFCSDTWHQATVTTEDEDGNVTTSVEDFELVEHAPEGAANITEITRLSVRYEELLAFIISTT